MVADNFVVSNPKDFWWGFALFAKIFLGSQLFAIAMGASGKLKVAIVFRLILVLLSWV
jgi:hypothetical protein